MRARCSMSLIGSMWPGLEMGGRQTLNELGEINTLLFSAFVFCVCSAFFILRARVENTGQFRQLIFPLKKLTKANSCIFKSSV